MRQSDKDTGESNGARNQTPNTQYTNTKLLRKRKDQAP